MTSVVQQAYGGNAGDPGQGFGGASSSDNGSASTTHSATLGSAPTEGNLLVMYYWCRDADNNAAPSVTPTTGLTKRAESTPMEYHVVGIASRVVQAADGDTWGISTTQAVSSAGVLLVEYDMADATFDKSNAGGTGAGNASSQATGSTGTLTQAASLVCAIGTSRTANDGLTSDLASATTLTPSGDSGSLNVLSIWKDVAATTALDVTFTESTGSSRMGAAIATFYGAGGGATDLVVEDLTVAATIDTPTLTQVHVLTVADASVAVSIDSPTLTQVHQLAVADLTVAVSIDAPTLTQVHNLVVADLTVAVTADAPTLTQTHVLTVADLTVATSIDTPTLTVGGIDLEVADLAVASSIDTPTLTQVHELVVADLTVAVTIDSPTLTVDGIDLEVADLTVAVSIDTPTLTQVHNLTVADLTIASTVDTPTLTQVHVLVVADLTVAVTIDTVTLGVTGAYLVSVVRAARNYRIFDVTPTYRPVRAARNYRIFDVRRGA